jgi:hypothetical protein
MLYVTTLRHCARRRLRDQETRGLCEANHGHGQYVYNTKMRFQINLGFTLVGRNVIQYRSCAVLENPRGSAFLWESRGDDLKQSWGL